MFCNELTFKELQVLISQVSDSILSQNATVLSHPRHGDDGGRGPCPVAMALGTQLLYLADTSSEGPGPQCADRSSRRWDVRYLCNLTFSCWQATG